MALSLDKHILSSANAAIRQHVVMELDFVGLFNDWSTGNVSQCVSSSGWSECVVDAYHLCAWDSAAPAGAGGKASEQDRWAPWAYSVCMFAAQNPTLECASPNSWPNSTCSAAAFPQLADTVSQQCAKQAGLDGGRIGQCVRGGHGAHLLEQSFNKSVSFYRNPKGTQIEPQWIEVDGPDCRQTGWDGCKGSFEKAHCEDWDHCDSEAWAKQLRGVVCAKAGIADCGSAME